MTIQTPQRVHNTMALYELTVIDGEFVVTGSRTALPFDHAGYSQFKYGRRDAAESYGSAIAELLTEYFADSDSQEPIVVTGTPYKRVPNAARTLAITAERHLRTAGFPTSYSYIYQHRLAEGDYGTLPAHLRDQRNAEKKRYLDSADFAGRHVVLIDDIRITGSIERSVLALLEDVPVLSTTIVNLVRLDPEVALSSPELEDRLNHWAVKGLDDLLRLMNQKDQFNLTTRAVKYVLQSDPSEVQAFLDQLDRYQIIDLYEAAADEGYGQMPRYSEVFDLVCEASQNPTRKEGR